jgi:hypothetical protein
MDRQKALRLAIRCARDSMPPLRLVIIDDLAGHPYSSLADVRKRLNKPRATVDRKLQALHMLGVLDVAESTEMTRDGKQVSRWYYTIADGIDPTAIDPTKLPDLSVSTPNPMEERDREDEKHSPDTDKPGNFAGAQARPPHQPHAGAVYARCQTCGNDLLNAIQRQRGTCGPCHMGTSTNQERAPAAGSESSRN